MNALEPVIAQIDWINLGWAVLLLLLAGLVLVVEFFVISFGMLSVVSVACVAGAIYFAFLAGPVGGWTFSLLTPLLAWWIIRWGIERLRSSRLVAQGEVAGEAGYHHVADRIGVSTGARGVMVTPARPSGRARFDGGECDVQSQGRPLEVGAGIVVTHIDGPIIFVAPVDAHSGDGESANPR